MNPGGVGSENVGSGGGDGAGNNVDDGIKNNRDDGVGNRGDDGVGNQGGDGVGNQGDEGVGSGRLAFARAIPDPSMRRTDLQALHPIMRESVAELMKSFQAEGLPFRVFEAFRTPERQAWLYEQGRGRPTGPVVTNAQAWSSYHQYGLAVDFVLWLNGAWSWSSLGVNAGRWERLHTLGGKVGLEPLQFETPHLQVAGLTIKDLRAGKFPADGAISWRDNLEAAVISWSGVPASPPIAALRPAIAM
jgi:hypothetical protein